MSADILRQAAALMRERAGCATSGPWTSSVVNSLPIVFDTHPIPSSVVYDQELRPGNADHIASWHPVVALAVADWLDVVAARYESLIDNFAPGSRAGAITAAENVTGWTAALAVARAYLGDPQ